MFTCLLKTTDVNKAVESAQKIELLFWMKLDEIPLPPQPWNEGSETVGETLTVCSLYLFQFKLNFRESFFLPLEKDVLRSIRK